MVATTKKGVTCNHFRDLASAQVDDELSGTDELLLEEHLVDCADCRAYRDDVWALRRSLRVAPVAQQSTERTERTVEIAGPLGLVSALRWGLFVIGGTLIFLNVQAILVGDAAEPHLGRHDGIFGTALGIGMLAVAAKPHRAIGLVPLTSAIAVLMVVAASVDLLSGEATIVAEAVHVVEFAGLLCLWVISGGPTRLHSRAESLAGWLRRPTVPEWPIA